MLGFWFSVDTAVSVLLRRHAEERAAGPDATGDTDVDGGLLKCVKKKHAVCRYVCNVNAVELRVLLFRSSSEDEK